jgi:hypothetical protein
MATLIFDRWLVKGNKHYRCRRHLLFVQIAVSADLIGGSLEQTSKDRIYLRLPKHDDR